MHPPGIPIRCQNLVSIPHQFNHLDYKVADLERHLPDTSMAFFLAFGCSGTQKFDYPLQTQSGQGRGSSLYPGPSQQG